MTKLSPQDYEAALARCNDAPIQSPGTIQPCGVLLGVDHHGLCIRYASGNAPTLFGGELAEILNRNLSEFLAPEDMHALRNAAATQSVRTKRQFVCLTQIGSARHNLFVSASGDFWALEIEPQTLHGALQNDHFSAFPFLMDQVYRTDTVQGLMQALVQLFAALSDYDRVLVYRFDADWNGEVIAEHLNVDLEPFLGLRFPHWDIPPIARAMMSKAPIRYIHDAGAELTPIVAGAEDLPPLDISLCQLRGTSPVHLQYLRNMGVAGTMTLSILVDGQLWGIVSFHNQTPKVPTAEFRQICASMAPVINTKMEAIQRAHIVEIHREIDNLKHHASDTTQTIQTLAAEVKSAIGLVQSEFDVDGVALGVDNSVSEAGCKLPAHVLRCIRERARTEPGHVWHTQSLREAFPGLRDDFGTVSGALCIDRGEGRWICLLRHRRTEGIHWAGAPRKEVGFTGGLARLAPRSSFSLYKQLVRDTSYPWQRHHIKMLEGVEVALIAANQRKVILDAIRRQHDLVVDELNHRVRNILTLVTSISRQARNQHDTLDSYSKAFDDRMLALARAHDLANTAGRRDKPVSIQDLLRKEADPHKADARPRLRLSGPDFAIRSEAAPILALVIHELMTNAVKHGALSNAGGQVHVTFTRDANDVLIRWVEMGGPLVAPDHAAGFGTTLIQQAVPFELSGVSQLDFHPEGLRVDIRLPTSLLVEGDDPAPGLSEARLALDLPEDAMPPLLGTVLLVEDNYMVAIETMHHLRSLGLENIELAASRHQARRAMKRHTIAFAVLDINLGHAGKSVDLARELEAQGIPFFFVSGYGSAAALPEDQSSKLKLRKPVTREELLAAIIRTRAAQEGNAQGH